MHCPSVVRVCLSVRRLISRLLFLAFHHTSHTMMLDVRAPRLDHSARIASLPASRWPTFHRRRRKSRRGGRRNRERKERVERFSLSRPFFFQFTWGRTRRYNYSRHYFYDCFFLFVGVFIKKCRLYSRSAYWD